MINLSGSVQNSTNLIKNSGNMSQSSPDISDQQIMTMPAPKQINSVLWNISNSKERRALMEQAGQDRVTGYDTSSNTLQSHQLNESPHVSIQDYQVKPKFSEQSKQPETRSDNNTPLHQPTLQQHSEAIKHFTNYSTQQTKDKITQQFQQRFSDMAQDKKSFTEIMTKTFGDKYDQSKAETIRQQTLSGDFSWMPDIKLVDSKQLNDISGTQTEGKALGAYSKENDTVYLSKELLNSNPAMAEKVLSEEVGHAIDTRVNVSDAKGDEGDIFSRFLHGETVSDKTLNELKQENDTGTAEIDGKKTDVEYSWLSKRWHNLRKSATKLAKRAKNSLKKVVQSKVFQGILTVAQFIPGVNIIAKGVQLATTAYNVYQGVKNKNWGAVVGAVVGGVSGGIGKAVTSAYNIYQGVKHKSWGAVLSGIAGIAGGVSNFGEKLGAPTGLVNGAATLSKYAATTATAYKAISERDFSAATSLASDIFGSNSKVTNTIDQLGKANQSVKNGDYLNALGVGSALMQEFTGDAGDKLLQKIGQNTEVLQKIQSAVKKGNFSTASSLLQEQYGGKIFSLSNDDKGKINQIFNLSNDDKEKINKVVGAFKDVHDANQLIKKHNYADAAQLLLKTAENSTSNPIAKQQLISASQTVQKIDDSINAVKEGRYLEGITTTTELLNTPLNDQSRKVLTDLQEYAEDAQKLKQLIISDAPKEVIREIKERMKEQAAIYNLNFAA
ncbi:MAG: zinc metallopeptidase [Candidatus Thiodiazotropha sp.]